MATRGRIQYQADGEHLIKGAKTFDIHPDLLEKIEEAGGGAIEAVKVNGVTQPITNKTVNITVPVVEDSLGSYSTTNALSANQGRVLYDAIQHLKSIGHFLSLWNAETGLPMDNPQLNPYPYNTGDYYIVSRVGSRNYRPSGAQYVAGQASTEEETETVAVDDFYFYNGTNWFHLSNEGPSLAIDTALSLTSTNAVENRVITNALNNKADRSDLDDYYTKTEVDDKIEAELQDVVKDGVTTIQKNGTDQGTISANQATNKTINITINKIDVGLENVDNTSDLNKPISTATQAALDLKADKTELDDYYKKTETYSQTEVDGKLDEKADKSTTYTKTEVDAFLDDKADKATTYTKTEVDALLDDKQDKLTAGDGISIVNKVISNTGVLTVNGEDGDVVVNDVKKKATSPSSPTQGTVWYDTTNDILKTYDGTDWNEVGAGTGDMLYEDFEFATKTGNAITLSISSKVVNPTANFTINAPSTIKDGITYVLRVQNGATPPTMTLGTNITNPYNVNLSLSASKTDTFAFLAVDGKLEMQPTEADVPDNVYTKNEVDTLLANKVDKSSVLEKVFEISTTTYSNLTEEDVDTLKEVGERYKSGKTPAIKCGNIVYRYHHNYDRETHEDSIAFVRDYVDGSWSDKIEEFYIVYLDLSNPSQGIDGVGIRELGTTFNPSNTGTNKQVLTKTSTGYKWDNVEGGDIKYEDFEFVTMTGTVIENLSATKSISADTTLTAGASLKEGMQYLVVVSNTDTAKHTVTFGSESVEIEAGESAKLVFLATSSSTLELQVCTGGGGGGETPGNGKLTINQKGTKKGEFTANQTTDVTVDIDADMSYEDFNFSAKTGTTVTLDLNTSISPSSNITVNKPAELKEGQTYILRVSPTANMSVTLGSGITNPFDVDLSLVANSTNQFVFLATSSSTLELQPEMLTRDDIDEILRSYGLIS